MAAAGIYLHDVLHQATIIVDEDGTVAAASTAVVGDATSAILNPPPALIIDHPYLLLIRDRPTGTVLFAGRVLDPLQ